MNPAWNIIVGELMKDAVNLLEDEPIENRIFLQKTNPFELSDGRFVKIFRLSKGLTRNLIEIVDQYTPPPMRASALDVTTMVLAALKFYATGGYQRDVGYNTYVGLSAASVSRSVKHVNAVLNREEIMSEWIKFPTTDNELTEARDRFWQKYQFPSTIGVIDCTHVAIFPPPKQHNIYPEHIFVNRKGYHSLNVQLICNADCRIIHVNARHSGSSHDNYIWNNCNVYPLMRQLYEANMKMFLLGDSGYALRPWMMTPVLGAPEGTPQEYFTQRLTSARSIIERVNGILKMRFRCLLKHKVLHYDPVTCAQITNACCVLHNMCIVNNIPAPELNPDDNIAHIDFGMCPPENIDVVEGVRVNPELTAGRRIQSQVTSLLWNRRNNVD